MPHDFMPHGYCFFWNPLVLWLGVTSDGLIALSYYCIPLGLVYLVRKRRDLPFNWIFWMFGLFIVSCGTTHLMEIWNIWHASYLLAGVIKAITATTSLATALMLIPLIPKAIELPTDEQLRTLNYELRVQCVEREQVEAKLRATLAAREQTLASLAKHQSAVEKLELAQEALRESRQRMDAIIQSAMDAIITVDEQQAVVIFNAAAERMFGCTGEEALGAAITRFIPQRFHAAHAGHMKRFGETGVSSRSMGTLGAIWGVRANGEEFPVEASISHAESEGKKLFTVILRDVTERRQAEAAREWLAAVVDSSDDAIISKDLQGIIHAWNRGAEKIFGYTAAEMVGKPMATLFPADRMQEEKDILIRVGQGKSVEHFETVRLRKDGTQIDVSVTISPIRNSDGEVVGASKIARNITERKRADERLAAQAEELSRQTEELARSQHALEAKTRMLQLVLDSMGEGLVAADNEGHFLLWNDAANKLVGRPVAELPTAAWSLHYEIYLPDGVTPFPPDQHPLARALIGEEKFAEMVVRPPGEKYGKCLEVTARPMHDAQGGICGGVAAFRDVTERRAAEGQVKQLNQELEGRVLERTAELEAFTYSVSHDLRAPLRHMSGFTRILVEDFGPSMPAEAQRYLQRIEQGAQRMGVLVDELLNLTRIGRQPLKVQVTGLDSIVREVIALLEPESEGRQIEWKIGNLSFVECDPVLIRQVFQNLIGNALKYSRPRTCAVIEIGQETKDGASVILVKDNGVGFSMKYADKLFGVFQRLHRAEDFEGTGVGLATVARIIQKHGGRVWAEAELDRGATFYFTLGGSAAKAVSVAGGQS
jgi:PAS domain S-box-containing protein